MESRASSSRIGGAIGYGSFGVIAGAWLFVSWSQWHRARDRWRDYQSQWNDALVGVVLIARRRRAGPAVAGAITGVAFSGHAGCARQRRHG